MSDPGRQTCEDSGVEFPDPSSIPPPPPPPGVPPPPPPSSMPPMPPMPTDGHPSLPPSTVAPEPTVYRPVGAPPGYVAYDSAGAGEVTSSKGLGQAVVAMYWATTAAALVLTLAFFHRKSVWEDFLSKSATVTDLDRADKVVGFAAVLQFALLLASAILTAVWSRRIARNAKARGNFHTNVRRATLGWFIPFGWFWVGFSELKQAARGTSTPETNVQRWQMLFLSQSVLGVVTRNVGKIDGSSVATITSSLRNQWLLGLVGAVLYAACTVAARKAIIELNQRVSRD